MSTIAINQLAVSGTKPADVQVLKVYPKTGKINLLFVSEGERKNDGTTKTGSDLNFAFLESNTGDADDWNLISVKSGGASTTGTVAAAGSVSGTKITVASTAGLNAGDVVAISGAIRDKLNGVFTISASNQGGTNITIDNVYDSSLAATSGLNATIVEVGPTTITPGGQENASVITQKKLLKIVGWGTTGGGYCRLDLQFNGLMGFGQVDIEVNAQKTGYGFFGNGAAGVGGMGRDTSWPETP